MAAHATIKRSSAERTLGEMMEEKKQRKRKKEKDEKKSRANKHARSRDSRDVGKKNNGGYFAVIPEAGRFLCASRAASRLPCRRRHRADLSIIALTRSLNSKRRNFATMYRRSSLDVENLRIFM